MGCCGGRRVIHAPARAFGPRRREPPETVAYQYTGRTALTAIGGVTGTSYRFARPGAIVRVDARDRWSLAKVPHLRPVTEARPKG